MRPILILVIGTAWIRILQEFIIFWPQTILLYHCCDHLQPIFSSMWVNSCINKYVYYYHAQNKYNSYIIARLFHVFIYLSTIYHYISVVACINASFYDTFMYDMCMHDSGKHTYITMTQNPRPCLFAVYTSQLQQPVLCSYRAIFTRKWMLLR